MRKTKLRPKYVPNPTDPNVASSAIFRITGACYFWQFCLFDGAGLVYTDPTDFSVNNQSEALFSHHKLTCFEYADGVNNVGTYGLTDLDMYYAKLSNAFNLASGRDIDDKYPDNPLGFDKQRPEWEIVGAFANDPIEISTIESGSGGTASNQVTVKTTVPHELTAGTPIKIKGVSPEDYNISTTVQSISFTDPTIFTYLLPSFRPNLPTPGSASGATVTIETDTVSGASPYVFNISLRSVYGMNGMLADGSKASGFRSMVVAQFTGVSLQKDDRAFVKYNNTTRSYEGLSTARVAGATLSSQSSSTTIGTAYHLEPRAIYRRGWESSHIKVTNDSFVQVVSVFAIGFNKHFDAETGGDLSITNSNSNFGQIAVSASGFKKEAFEKDNNAFITSIIAPRAIVSETQNIDWIALDVQKTISVANNTRLYLFGFTAPDDVPPILTQGYRIGAKVNDTLHFVGNGTEYSASILMSDGVASGAKQYSVTSGPTSNIFTIGTHTIQTGEKVIILSDVGDLPENIVENTVYYAIRQSSTQIKLASSASNATSGTAITVYGGTSLKILSRVSDKVAGDIGSPVQFDVTNKQWYIITNANSEIYTAINSLGVAVLSERTEPSYVRRTEDTRSLDEKIYTIRVVIPKELTNAKNPENGFIIQESSSTGARELDFILPTLTQSDYDYNKNQRFIAKCTRVSSTVTVISELAHNLQVGDTIIIKNVTDSTNTAGADNLGYNGTFVVASIVDDMTFTYAITRTPGTTFTNNTANRTTSLPRFQRNDLQSNLYVYRNEIISPYIENTQDGVYHIYALSADKAVPTEFTNLKYSQNVVDLYPQLDRDNVNDTPTSAKSFAKRSFIGEVVTNDLKKSITKEATDTLLTTLGVGLDVSSVTSSTSTATITFSREHGLAGIVTYSSLTPGSGYTNGTYHNVKLLNGSQTGTWQGATARVSVSGGVTSVDIISSGSGYSAGDLFFDAATIGAGSNAKITIATSGITTSIGHVVQFTGAGTTSDGYYRITSVPNKTQIAIAKTAGDPVITTDQYALTVGPTVTVSSAPYSSATGITTFTLSAHHGLVAGNRCRVLDSSNNNLGDFIINERIGTNVFTAITNRSVSSAAYILKHGLSANEGTSDSSAENLGIRGVPLFAEETLTAVSFTTTTQIRVSSSAGATGITKRFPLGSYIQIDDEIMRVSSRTLSGTFDDEITVIRGALGTKQSTHDDSSLISKINPIAVEFRRPSIVRASGHTFEYLGYGPGNYSTGLPQVQVTSLTEREEFLVQSQERSGGVVVYNGINNNGDVFNGNNKTSASSGEIVSYDIPKPTVTGEDPSRLSVVFDEATVKERLVVEGGNSNTVLSQFNGPVTFNKEVKLNNLVSIKSQLKLSNTADSTTPATGSLVVAGGVGIAKTLNVGGGVNVTGNLNINTNKFNVTASNGNTTIDGSLTVNSGIGITAAKFVKVGAGASTNFLKAGGADAALTGSDVTDALGYVPANSASISGTFPLGNSLLCDPLSFNGVLTDFTLRINTNEFTPAGGPSNLLVSLGGVIQKPGSDFFIVQSSGINTSTIRFTTAPAAAITANHFIVALGGQGSLVSNIDWNAKGQILVGTADNSAFQLNVGTNDQVLTADSTTVTGVAWKTPSIPSGSVMLFYQAAAPTGWTRVDTQNNKALRVVSGTGPTGGGQGTSTGGSAGGTTAFTTVFASRTVTGSVSGGSVSVSVSGNTGGTSLTVAQLPTHQHGLGDHSHGVHDPGHNHTIENCASVDGRQPDGVPEDFYRTNSGNKGTNNNQTGITIQNAVGATGSGVNYGLAGQAHSHTFGGSGSGSLSDASFSGDALDFAVQYIDVIICSKN